jgi:dihydroxyacetone kinase-like predicted kinase
VTGKEIHVLPTVSAPQGIAALVAFDGQADQETNLAAMQEALADVRWGEVTRAIRLAQISGVAVPPGEAIGLADGELVASAAAVEEVLVQLPPLLEATEGSLLTVYFGNEVSREAAEAAVARLRERFPETGVELVYGGQPHYPYILSVE